MHAAVAPGLVDTPFIRERPDAPVRPGAEQRYALKRIARPEEIADAILFLTGPASRIITGITIAADGGRTYH